MSAIEYLIRLQMGVSLLVAINCERLNSVVSLGYSREED